MQAGPSLEEKRRMLLQFGSRAVHDVAGPIDQVSSLMALFIRRYRGKIDEDADALLVHIDNARRRLSNTGIGLRKYFQIVTADCGHAPSDLNLVLKSVLAHLTAPIRESAAELHVGSLPVVDGDSELLVLLFQSLLENSLKFRREGIPPRIEISASRTLDRHSIVIADNGIGIDPAQCEVVFEPFKKIHGHVYPGTGLGLTMARTIAELHGGSLRLEPGESEGVRVIFELPAH